MSAKKVSIDISNVHSGVGSQDSIVDLNKEFSKFILLSFPTREDTGAVRAILHLFGRAAVAGLEFFIRVGQLR